MSKVDILKCDVCGMREDYADVVGDTLHIRKGVGYIKHWYDRTKRTADICNDCYSLIRYLRDEGDDNMVALRKLFDYRVAMCGADQYEFDELLRKASKAIDRYADRHAEVYKVIKRATPKSERNI